MFDRDMLFTVIKPSHNISLYDFFESFQMRNGVNISYFVPYKLSSDVCGDNGLPVCPNSTRILGIGKVLKSIRDPFLQQLIEIEAGKQVSFCYIRFFCNQFLTGQTDSCPRKIRRKLSIRWDSW